MSADENEREITVDSVVDYLRITGGFTPILCEAERRMVAAAARKAGMTVDQEELQRASDVFRLSKGLDSAAATESWLKENGIALEALEEYLEINLLISKFKEIIRTGADTGR